MRIWFVVGLAASCYAAKPQPGSPCSDLQPCPPTLVCSPATSMCETSLTDATIDSSVGGELDACVPTAEICGDGIDQDCDGSDPPCPANDLPGNAIDVTAGGNFTATLTYAGDDSQKPAGSGAGCGGTGGRDVFYKVHLTVPEVYYFDTFDSDFDSVIRTYPGACEEGAAPSGNTKCGNDACTVTQSQLAVTLGAGDTCIVIDQNSSAETNGSLHLHVEVGHRNGTRIATGDNTQTGNTTSSTDSANGTCSSAGNNDNYFFTLCPDDSLTLTATTCNAATMWDTSLYADGPGGQLACDDDDANCTLNTDASAISTPVAGAHLFWVIVDAGAPDAAGAYELDTTIL